MVEGQQAIRCKPEGQRVLSARTEGIQGAAQDWQSVQLSPHPRNR